MNPPFKNNLHLQFLKKSLEISDRVITIQPCYFIINNKLNYPLLVKGKKLDLELRKILNNRLRFIRILNPNLIWKQLHFTTPVGIMSIDKDNICRAHDSTNKEPLEWKEINYLNSLIDFQHHASHISEITKYPCMDYGHTSAVTQIMKLVYKNGSLFDHLYSSILGQGKEKYFINLEKIKGTPAYNRSDIYSNPSMYSMVPRKAKIADKEEFFAMGGFGFGFETLEEAENCLWYIKSKIALYALSLFKSNYNIHNGELKSVPWIDFTVKHDTTSLPKLFGLTPAAGLEIGNAIPKLYPDMGEF